MKPKSTFYLRINANRGDFNYKPSFISFYAVIVFTDSDRKKPLIGISLFHGTNDNY